MTTGPTPSEIRFKVDPGDVAPEKAARRLGLTLPRFNEVLPGLIARGSPAANPDTGNFDLGTIHPKAMPVILTTPGEVETWMTAPADDALTLQRPLREVEGADRSYIRGLGKVGLWNTEPEKVR